VAVVLDSNAVIGFLDPRDALHTEASTAIRELAREQSLVVSAVTYAEVLMGALIGRHDEGHVTGFFAELISAVVSVDIHVAAIAAELRAGAKTLQMPDALILATAETDPKVELVLTGDRAAAKVPNLKTEVRLLVPA
jgi:predicted nucleic acid-binding protein